MKKGICLLLALILIISFCGCGKKEKGNEVSSDIISGGWRGEELEPMGEGRVESELNEQSASDLTSSGNASVEKKENESGKTASEKKEDKPQKTETVIPSGCRYITAEGVTINEGQPFPALKSGDEFYEGDYKYKYKARHDSSNSDKWITSDRDGWGVSVIDRRKTDYSKIRESINGDWVKFLDYAFYQTDISKCPELPSHTESLNGTFMHCEELSEFKRFPDNLVEMDFCFCFCFSLNSIPSALPSSVKSIKGAFQDCGKIPAAPVLSEALVDMNDAFSGCVLLKACPTIPANVRKLARAFFNCPNITGDVVIRAKEVDDYGMFITGVKSGLNFVGDNEVVTLIMTNL